MEAQQTEATRAAIKQLQADFNSHAESAAGEIRRLHARNQELEAMLDAVGAGGVSAQRITQAADHIAQDRKMVAVPVEVPKVGSAWRHKNGNAYRVVAIANNCDAHFSERYPVTVVYQGENGKMWARRADDWHRSMTHDSAAPATAPVVLPEPDAWAAVYFSGKQAGKIYTTCDTKEQIEAYIHQVHQSNDSITLRAEPIYMRAAAPHLQADARDAQRYRWLRAQPLESDIFCITIWRKGTDGFGDDLRLEKLDDAIDAAIAAAKEAI